MSTTTEQPRKRPSFGAASFGIGLLDIIVAYALLNRATGEAISPRLFLLGAGIVFGSLLAGASALYALARRESSRAYAFFGLYLSIAGILYVIRELLV
jgi:hypothetical protein